MPQVSDGYDAVRSTYPPLLNTAQVAELLDLNTRTVLAMANGTEASEKEAYVMQMSEDWTMDGDLPVHSLLLSLQGLANRESPQLYLEYPPSWPWKITGPLREFYERKHDFSFIQLNFSCFNIAKIVSDFSNLHFSMGCQIS